MVNLNTTEGRRLNLVGADVSAPIMVVVKARGPGLGAIVTANQTQSDKGILTPLGK